MGRNRKFQPGDKAVAPGVNQPVTIVDYKQDRQGRGRYRILLPYKAVTRWMEGAYLVVDRMRPDKSRVATVQKNEAIPDRGCDCHCCIHVAVPLSEVNKDGSFKWDN